MTKQRIPSISIQDLHLWEKRRKKRNVFSFELEITARCNNNCRYCYINFPAGDRNILKRELTFREIKSIADQAVSLGALWSLLTGGEPLLREDFLDIYIIARKPQAFKPGDEWHPERSQQSWRSGGKSGIICVWPDT